MAVHDRVDQAGDRPSIAADGFAVPGGAVPLRQGGVGVGVLGPLGFVLDADGVAALVDGFDQGGADPAHRVDDDVRAQ